MAVRQVYGEPISFRDIFSGSAIVARMIVSYIVFNALTIVGLAALLIPGVFIAGLLLPTYAMIADGTPVFEAMRKSFAAMWHDRGVCAAFVFVVGVIIVASVIPLGIGLLVTLPMFCLISALAYRDMIGLRRLRHAASMVDEALPWEGEMQGPPAALAGDDYDDDPDAVSRIKRFSLTGEPLDEKGNIIPPK
jgi:hypothetical protein